MAPPPLSGWRRTVARLIATGFGIGRAAVAPGTVASAIAAGFWYVIHPAIGVQWAACSAMIAAGLWAADLAAKQMGAPDPSVIVIDEVAGMWLALFGLPHTLPVVVAAFVLFRLLDIGKFPPMKQLERLPGGLGIMLDDVAAGLIVRAILGIVLSAL